MTVTLADRLLSLAALWARDSGRSTATLASRVARDGKTFDRLRDGGGCTTALADRFFAFFRDGENWTGQTVPAAALAFIDNVELGVAAHPADDGPGGAGASAGNEAGDSPQEPTHA